MDVQEIENLYYTLVPKSFWGGGLPAKTFGKNLVFVSAVVIWEIRIKQALEKLKIPLNFRKVLVDQPFEMLDITVEHAHAVGGLPFNTVIFMLFLSFKL